ncbi:hypothetical protein [Absidia glauca]|uniref:No apical meristem-associated C-terminal domain-containing protein n=1 Tax=Absidia glauca TaxID=4829 RepID=A0A168QER0_ABSGL|nr:hypothetical protein [Absidia glauca]
MNNAINTSNIPTATPTPTTALISDNSNNNNNNNNPTILVESDPAEKTPTRASKFTEEEDIQLCKSFLAVSFDFITTSDQTSKTLWDRIYTDYNNRIHDDLKGVRASIALSNRWNNVINPRCSYFSRCLTQVKNAPDSGSNDRLHEREAKRLFYIGKKKTYHFTMMQCFRILSVHPKWMERYVNKPTTKPRAAVPSFAGFSSDGPSSDGPSSDGPFNDTMTRPIGPTQARALARKRSDGDDDTLAEFREYIKQSNLDRNRLLKEKLEFQKNQLRAKERTDAEFIRIKKTKIAIQIMTSDVSSITNALNRQWFEDLQASVRDGSFFLPITTNDSTTDDSTTNDPTSDVE